MRRMGQGTRDKRQGMPTVLILGMMGQGTRLSETKSRHSGRQGIRDGKRESRSSFLLVLSLFFVLSSCEPPVMPLPGVTGKSGELIVVMADEFWKGAAGDTVFNTLAQHVYGLPQVEPMFNVVHIKSSAFTKIFRTHRNIVLINIGKGYKQSIELKKDVWASPQIVVEVSAPNVNSFVEVFGKNGEKIIAHVQKKEQERTRRSYKAQLNHDIVAHLKEERKIKLIVPVGYNLVGSEDDFSWIRYETKDVTQSILVYTEPYQRENTFTHKDMIEVMNSFCKKYIPGPDQGTYMQTYLEYPPIIKETSLADIYATKLTGLWRVEGALMGGPFVTYALLDESRNRVIYLCGFVFAPGKKKRNYLRQVDAIVGSLVVLPE